MHFREYFEDSPHYVLFPGEETSNFTVDVVYNGFFCGLSGKVEYVSPSLAQFDYCTTDTWSMHWVNEILRILGCERDERLHVYWLLPGKDCTDGLVPIENQSVIRQMINASWSNKSLCMFNSYILEAREMPFLPMLETIFYKILQRTETKQREALKMTGRICPKIRKKLEKFFEWSNECAVTPAGNYLYSVSSHETEKEFSVDFNSRTCDCRRWQLTGIPCHHAIACCRKDQINPENLVHGCCTFDSFHKAYAFNLAPLRGRAFWKKMNGVTIHPPLFTKVMGMPKKNRKKAPEEKMKNGVKTFTKAGVTIHCSICGKANHNKKGHQKYLDSLAEQIQNNIVGQDENFDIPEILQHVIPHTPNPLLDPTQLQDSMMYAMQEEEKEYVPISRLFGPLPENAFVVAARDSIPASRVRVTTASTRGNLRGRGRGRGRSSAPRKAEKGSTSSGRGKGKKRPVNAEASGSGTREIAQRSIPDLNEQLPNQDAQEVTLTQNAQTAEDNFPWF